MISKNCTKCGGLKPLTDFGKNVSQRDNKDARCKICKNEDVKLYRRTKMGLVVAIFSHQKEASKHRCHKPPLYSLNSLREWLLSQDSYHLLYDNWVKSGYKKELSPSIDRIDDYKGYSFDNIQLMTWSENDRKGSFCIRNGINNKLSKAVKQITKDNVEIKTHISISMATRDTGAKNIGKCLAGERKTAGGFKWCYA